VIRRLDVPGAAARELIARSGACGSTLVIDRDAATAGDERLLAHLPADEPRGNAALICTLYADSPPALRRCRPVTGNDELAAPPTDDAGRSAAGDLPLLIETPEASFRLEPLPSRMSIPELRWTEAARDGSPVRTVSLRDVIAALEDYEPMCSITLTAIAAADGRGSVSTSTVRSELARVMESPIVLNRGLREAVRERVEHDRSSLSEIAIRCGRTKRDSRGSESGETSWLARRIGILPEGGQSRPTVWVHSDVLALIAREGLGIGPREVELG